MESSIFISTDALQELLNTGNVRVLDSGIEAKNNHFEKRIPKAKYFSIPEIRNSHSSLSQEVPGLDEFRGYMKRLGLMALGSANSRFQKLWT